MCKESKVSIDQLTQNNKFLKSYIELCENEFFFFFDKKSCFKQSSFKNRSDID